MKYLEMMAMRKGNKKDSAVNCIDLGDVRIQWGSLQGGSLDPTITFPKPFKDNTYSFNATIKASVYIFTVQITTKYADRVTLNKKFWNAGSTSNASGEPFDWIAVGMKP